MESKEFIRGTIKTLVLKLLSEKKKMYGYEISARVKELSANEIQLTYGALYPILYKLEAEGLLSTESELFEGRARKYYSLTKKGNEVAKVKVSELQKFMDIVKNILAAPKTSLESWGY
ncbi:PadR family transcriptional regulator [Fulvivirgaceae bacterium BMA10]|uniref:PadR family transcriptional regulator n=1 Tax=Splendidivirga corallicola TaxID=3051826 RepID=A0ABT8KTQ6_9BACT|nr:PadR family transcriptional regulator [Fulvivirgaceae bacterium BMA10]